MNEFTRKESPFMTLTGMGGGNSSRLLGAITTPLGRRSLRFNDDDSAYLHRTPSSESNRQTWTWAAWVKRSAIGTNQKLFSAGTGSNYFALAFNNNDKWQVDSYGGGSNAFYMHTGDRVFRDTNGWYHLTCVLDTTEGTGTDRFKLYVNGSQASLTVGTNVPPQDADQLVNSTIEHRIGNAMFGGSNQPFDGYLTDVHFVDGQALSPTSFGSFDSYGVWQRGTYSGSYGTNGYHMLDFENVTEIGKDSSGQGSDYTANNFTSTGTGIDLLLDFPQNDSTTDTAVGGEIYGNYCTFNALDKGNEVTLSNGNLDAACTSSSKDGVMGSIGVSSGKWYWEIEVTSNNTDQNVAIGIARRGIGYYQNDASSPTSDPGPYFYSSYNGNKWLSNSDSSYGASYGNGDVIGVALDLDNNSLVFYKNGSTQGTAISNLPDDTYYPFVGDNANNAAQSVRANFGQRPFAYTAPGNHKCLTTSSLPTPTILKGKDHFDQILYVGNQTSRSITGLSFSPDLVIVKNRDRAAYNHYWVDSVRGGGRNLYSNSNEAEHVADRITSLDSAGFSLSDHMGPNYSGENYISHCWDAGSSTVTNNNGTITSQVRASTAAGFSIVSYTGNGTSGATIGHGLGRVPEFWLLKDRNSSDMWVGRHKGVPNTHYMEFNGTAQQRNAVSDVTGDSDPTTSVIPVGSADSNNSGRALIAYIWAPIPGFSAAPQWTGNSSTDGIFLNMGFRPKAFWFKRTDSSANWYVYDSTRSTTNVVNKNLEWNTGDAENVLTSMNVDFVSNGVKIRGNDGDINGAGNYIGFAWAENPFQMNGGLAR